MKNDSTPPSPRKPAKANRFRLVALLIALGMLAAVYRTVHTMHAESLLRRSLLNGELEGVQAALDSGADPDLQLDLSLIEHPYSLADSLAEFVRLLLHGSPPPDENAKTALMFAAGSSHVEMVAALLQHGAHVNLRQGNGYSALLYAASKSSPTTVETLLAHGADVHVQNGAGTTPLLSATAAGQIQNVRLLLAKGADIHESDHKSQTALSLATENRSGKLLNTAPDEEMIRLLLAQGADERDLNPTHLAALDPPSPGAPSGSISSNLPVVQTVTPLGGDALPQSHIPLPPIAYAAKYGNLPLLKFLWARADPATRQRVGAEAVCKVVTSSRIEALQFLLDRHAPVNLPGATPATPGSNGSERTAGYTPLHFAAGVVQGYDLRMNEMLIAHGADVNAASADDTTPLLLAADGRRLALVRLLLSHGANVRAVDSRTGRNALIRSNGNIDLMRLFLSDGLEVNAQDNLGRTALMHCDNPLAATLLLTHGANVNIRDKEGETPLIIAAKDSISPNLIALFLQHGAEVNARNNGGATALMQCRDPQIAALLLAHGANVNVQDIQGDTPLLTAMRLNTTPYAAGAVLSTLLLKNGANVSITNKKGETPLFVAKHSPQAAVLVPLLTKAGATH